MQSTIDGAGRVVIPKPIREMAGILGEGEIEITYRDGKIEIEPRTAELKLVNTGMRLVIHAPAGTPVLKAAEVREAIQAERASREGRHVGRGKGRA